MTRALNETNVKTLMMSLQGTKGQFSVFYNSDLQNKLWFNISFSPKKKRYADIEQCQLLHNFDIIKQRCERCKSNNSLTGLFPPSIESYYLSLSQHTSFKLAVDTRICRSFGLACTRKNPVEKLHFLLCLTNSLNSLFAYIKVFFFKYYLICQICVNSRHCQ